MNSLPDVRSPSFFGHQEDPLFFQREDALTRLGAGNNSSIRHWLLCCDLVQFDEGSERGALKPTDLGVLIFADDGWDPFLECTGTLFITRQASADLEHLPAALAEEWGRR